MKKSEYLNELDGCLLLIDNLLSDSIHTYFDVTNVKCCKYKEGESTYRHNDFISYEQLDVNLCDSTFKAYE